MKRLEKVSFFVFVFVVGYASNIVVHDVFGLKNVKVENVADSLKLKSDTLKNVVLSHDFENFRLYYFNYPVTFTEIQDEAKKDGYMMGSGGLEPFLATNAGKIDCLSSKRVELISLYKSNEVPSLYNFEGDDIFVEAESFNALSPKSKEIKLFLTKKQKYDAWFIAWKDK